MPRSPHGYVARWHVVLIRRIYPQLEDAVTYVRFVSLTVCLQGLVVILIATFELLRPFHLEHKFLCIKLFLLLIGLQGIVLILLLRWDIIRKSPL